MARQDFTKNNSDQNFGSLENKQKSSNSVQRSFSEGHRGASSSSRDEDLKRTDTAVTTPSSIGSREEIDSEPKEDSPQ